MTCVGKAGGPKVVDDAVDLKKPRIEIASEATLRAYYADSAPGGNRLNATLMPAHYVTYRVGEYRARPLRNTLHPEARRAIARQPLRDPSSRGHPGRIPLHVGAYWELSPAIRADPPLHERAFMRNESPRHRRPGTGVE